MYTMCVCHNIYMYNDLDVKLKSNIEKKLKTDMKLVENIDEQSGTTFYRVYVCTFGFRRR